MRLVLALGALIGPVSWAGAGDPLPIGHRGLLQHAPENTLAGFGACLDLRLGFGRQVSR
ncbi:MAG: hypothetical protein U0793_24600 [Gemmataceae bacterium]